MKKVRIFLGVAMVGVAIVAAAATSAKKLTVTYYYYDTNVIPAQCVPEEFVTSECVLDGTKPCTDGNGNQLYLSRLSSTTCVTALTKY